MIVLVVQPSNDLSRAWEYRRRGTWIPRDQRVVRIEFDPKRGVIVHTVSDEMEEW